MNIYDKYISKTTPQYYQGINNLIPQLRINNILIGVSGLYYEEVYLHSRIY